MKSIQNIFFPLMLVCAIFTTAFADEGMYPISEISRLDLKSKGLEINPSDIYNPNGIGLIDGIVKINGCSGSFVSGEGLILTNHHCGYGALQTASSEEHDYIANGFLAKNRSEEIPAAGYKVRITQSYRDVSGEVLQAVEGITDPAGRTDAIDKRIKEIIRQAEKENPGKRAEVSEMFIGKTYVLFLYTYLKDVRIVYAPPRSIGEFGGEFDNWEWPRHTGDFTFMRVYVAPNGSPAEYSPENVPYKPKKHFQVSAAGVNEEDFVFILGYPARTQRHYTSDFVAYDEEVYLPHIVELYDWEISVMEEKGKDDPVLALKCASKIKSRSNTLKRSRGKLQGLKRLDIVARKREQEKALQAFIEADKERKRKYADVLPDIRKVYEGMRENFDLSFALDYLPRSSDMFYFAKMIYDGSIERQKIDIERASTFMDRNFSDTKERMRLKLQNYDETIDRIFLKNILTHLLETPAGQDLPLPADLREEMDAEAAFDRFVENLYNGTKLSDETYLMEMLEKTPREIEAVDDPFIQFAIALHPAYEKLKEDRKQQKGALSELYAELIEVKQQFLKTDFIPDANGTLRLTYGRVRGYSPADAVYMNPITTLKGIVEKTTGKEPFDTPQKLLELYGAKDYGQFKYPRLNDVPVDILYNTDTTGGNSGSAVLNARGEIVGVNFDRTFQATINDYAWNESYSRSIGVDIRYVLWITRKFAEADYILTEMNVKK